MRSIDAPVLDLAAIESAFDAHVSGLASGDRALATGTLARVRPPNWTLEWYLPWWLGHALGVHPEVSLRIVVSNVLGLVAARLEDDAIDGEVAHDEVAAARRVSVALFDAAIGIYRPIFDSTSPFWAVLERTLSEWLSADRRSLARRGAPLNVGAQAICLLADQPGAWRTVGACLDHALAALARYDDLCDWEADLAAGRWNVFVASVTKAPQSRANASGNRSAVLTALMLDGAAAAGFAQVDVEAGRAAALARAIGCAPLADHLASIGTRAMAQGAAVDGHYVGVADRATTLIFGAALHGGTG